MEKFQNMKIVENLKESKVEELLYDSEVIN